MRYSRLQRVAAFSLAMLVGAGILAAPSALGQTVPNAPGSLRSQIEEKARTLKELQSRRDVVEKNLEEVRGSSDSLKNELRAIDATVNQLNLSVRANEVTVEKLDLEYDELGDEIIDTQESIKNTKETIGKLFTELQQRDRENLLMVLLRNSSLSGGVSEIQTLTTLQGQLVQNIGKLRDMQSALAEKRATTEANKRRREVELVNLANRQSIAQDQKQEKQVLLSVTKSQEQIYQQQLEDLKALQAQVSEEIEGIESQLRSTIDKNLLPIPRVGVLLWPVNGGRVSQLYGRTKFAIRNYGSQYHNGIDIAASLGTEIFAPANGTVISTGDQDKYRGCRNAGYGRFIVVKHENGLTTLYGHLSRVIVVVGQPVTKGEVIGYVGHTGWATGSHLHFTVFASQTLTPARPGFPEGTTASSRCGPMPVGGDLDPTQYVEMR
ncbi:MAG: peptidoglycan DD-metalloendopeptidase family protein [Candidatus Jorgensenbacteria bacterium]